MSLGSTAKLRTLVHYLEVIEGLHQDLSGLDDASLGNAYLGARDPLTRWVCETLIEHPSMPVESLLTRAVERTYSASPGERFFTGGGLHAFVNFDDRDDGRRMSIRDAAAHSTNLVFVRLMRDLVRYHEARLPYSPERVLSGADSVRRRTMLEEIIDEESRSTLSKAYGEYRGLMEQSADARRVASEWLFRTRNRHAQDLRLRTRFERDAFARMTPYWRRLGFPFQRPSRPRPPRPAGCFPRRSRAPRAPF